MRILPRIVARTTIGTAVEIEVTRKGTKVKYNVMIGRRPEAAVAEEPATKTDKELKKEFVLGLSIAPLSDELRTRFKIAKTVKVKGSILDAVGEGKLTAEQAARLIKGI